MTADDDRCSGNGNRKRKVSSTRYYLNSFIVMSRVLTAALLQVSYIAAVAAQD